MDEKERSAALSDIRERLARVETCVEGLTRELHLERAQLRAAADSALKNATRDERADRMTGIWLPVALGLIASIIGGVIVAQVIGSL